MRTITALYCKRVRVVVADPPAYTPWYDHELAAALARAGAEVEMATTRFRFGEVPAPAGYTRTERFYPLSSRVPGRSRARLPLRAAEHLGVLAFTVGDLDSAQEHLERALAGAEELGFQLPLGDVLGYLALVALERGDLDAARARAERASGIAREADLNLLVAYAGLVNGQVSIATGDLDGAEVAFESAMKTFADVGQTGQEAECRAGLARVALARGDVDGAVSLVEPLLPRLDSDGLSGAIRVGEVLVTCWDVLSAAGDPRAPGVLATARAYLDARVALIDDDAMRAAFLSTPAVARLLNGNVG